MKKTKKQLRNSFEVIYEDRIFRMTKIVVTNNNETTYIREMRQRWIP